MIRRVLLIASIVLLFMLFSTARAATLTGNVHFVVNYANGTNLNYALYNVTSTTGTVTLGYPGFWDIFPLSAATTEDAQYCIQINGNWINITNSTGYLKASLYDSNFWKYVNSTGADVRITNQSSQLYFWIQDFNTTTEQATIWVNLTARSTELCLYYGNPAALPSVYNNASKTFLFYDDFSNYAAGSLAGQNGWYSVNYGNLYTAGEITVNNSTQVVQSNAGSESVCKNISIDSTNVILHFWIQGVYTGNYEGIVLINKSGTGWFGGGLDLGSTTLTIYPAYVTGEDLWASYGTQMTTDWQEVTIHIIGSTEIIDIGGQKTVVVLSEINDGFSKIAILDRGNAAKANFKEISIMYGSDPATFGTPYQTQTKYISIDSIHTTNATASINGITLVAPVLNATVPSQTFTLPSLAAANWLNFSAESGDFSANVTFSFTSTFTQNETANFTELVVSSDVYVPANCTSNTLTISFNTSSVPAGVVIYSYNLSVLVNGSEVNFTKTATESLNVWYFTISVSNLKQGWHSVKVLLVYQPAYLNITVYDANNVTSLLDKTLNVTVYDQNFNILTSATVNKTANISVVFAGKVFVRISNSLGVARQLEATITPGNTTYLTFYFPSANVVIATLQFLDYTNSFSNATVIIKRYISRNVIVPVDEQKMTAQMQTSHYLIANVPYEVYVTNGVDTRDLGYISLAYSQTLQLVIGNILNVQAYPYVGVAFNISTTNETIEITYKTIKGTTSSVDVVITNSTGYVVYNTTLTTPEGKVTYLITNPNETYYVSFHAENSFEPVSYRTVVTASGVQFEPVLPVVAGGTTLAITAQSLPLWARLLFFGGLGIFVALLFKRSHVAIGLTMSLAVLAVFTLMGVLPLQTNTLWVLALIVMVAWFVWWRERR